MKDFWTKVVNFAESITSRVGSRLIAETGKVQPSDKADGSWVTASAQSRLSSAPLQIDPFPCRIRVLGAATYDCLTVANGTALGAVEFRPKIWDIAATWVIVQAAGAIWLPLEPNPIFPLLAEQDYHSRYFPTLVVTRNELVPMFRPQVEKLLHYWQNRHTQLPT